MLAGGQPFSPQSLSAASRRRRPQAARGWGHAREGPNYLAPHEALLWESLKGSNPGVGFRRQVILGDATKKLYIVDFCAPSRKLVVEVDDTSHIGREAQDARRDAALGRLGYRVVRIPVALLDRDFAAAIERIRWALRQIRER